MNIQLVIIDPQKSFTSPKGELFVKGADKDMVRLAEMVVRVKDKLDDIHVTLDSHHLIDIAHPIFWQDSNGKHPVPYTIISVDDVVLGKWTTTNPKFLTRAVEYVKKLAENKRYPLCIWPPHCLIGSDGYKVDPTLYDALLKWEDEYFAMVNYVTKGSNFWTEHYSAVQADVPDPSDPGTMLNTGFIETLKTADVIALAGEAKDYCVYNTLKDIVDNFGDESNIQKFVLLEDCMSNVMPKTPNSDKFYNNLVKKGMKIVSSLEFLK